ncbi:MAG: S24 family peptidase [Bacteroidota bacterium]
MPPAHLTKRQDQVYEHIRAYVREQGKPPTLKEIGAALSIRSTNGVSKHLAALEQKGYIRRTPNEARGISLVDAGTDPYAFDADVPSLLLVSRTDSAQPSRLRRRPKGALFADPLFLNDADEDDCLIGRAGDDGMGKAGILKGDYLVIQETKWRRLGDGIVVAALVGESLLAREFHLVDNKFHLRSADRTYPNEVFSVKDPGCHVIGPVRSVMRRL